MFELIFINQKFKQITQADSTSTGNRMDAGTEGFDVEAV
jgi:hypothetical protein